MAKSGSRRPQGGETHQTAGSENEALTTNQGAVVADNQNSLKSGPRGATLLEDHVLREKITHFDHERIPERIVHARGSAAHGYFKPLKSLSRLTRASFLQDPAKKTRVFVRFSTVAGGAGSADTVRDVRGFAVKFYTDEGNFDLVGNNIPIFFIQDAMKFPDLVHAVKMEPDRGFPQAASAHDTFWDFASLMPESMHMLVWAMSDRAIPRSFRMMEGFGVHTFRFVNAAGKSTFVKFHWRPANGSASLIWDEAVKIAGADCDFHRRDLWEAIDSGDFPEYTLAIQAFDERKAASLDFDILDPTKLIPEELVPLEPIGTLVLDRNPDNFFAETEQAAFHPGNVVPGVDFTDDPLLQGRLFSYIDTQLIRLGGPNFHEIPINKPVCPMRNFQRDGHMRMVVPKGRVAYEPNSLAPEGPREDPRRGFITYAAADQGHDPGGGEKLRQRPESFADHYSQARQFFRSMTEPEQNHIVGAFAFELGKVETLAVRKRMLGHLDIIEPALGKRVADALGMVGQAETIKPAAQPRNLEPSPALSIVGKAPETIAGRKIAILATDGADAALLDAVARAAKKGGAKCVLIAPKVGGITDSAGKKRPADMALAAAPSVLFDAIVVAPGDEGGEMLAKDSAAAAFVADAFAHLKVIGHVEAATALFDKAGVEMAGDDGLVALDKHKAVEQFIAQARRHRIWEREPKVRPIF